MDSIDKILAPAKKIGVIEITVCLFCTHHRDQHGPKGCNFCECPKRNNRLPQVKPKP